MATPARRRELAALLSGLLICIGLAGLSHHAAVRQRAAFPAEDDLVYLPRSAALKAMAAGHHELFADLVFMKTILYFSTQLSGSRDYSWLRQHLDTVSDLDPAFRAPYLFGSRSTMYNGRAITNQMVEDSSHFARRGIAQFPGDWELAFTLGCNYLFELKTDDPKQREAWRREGGRWFRRAALAGGGPAWLPGLAARVMTDEGEAEAGLRYLEEAFLTAPDEAQREEVRRLLLARRRDQVGRLEAAEKAFRETWQRTLPYAPADLFVLVGPPRDERLDLPFLTHDEVLEADARAAHEAEERDRQ